MSSPASVPGLTASSPSSSPSFQDGAPRRSSDDPSKPCQPNLRPPASAATLGVLGLLPFIAASGIYAYGPPQLAGPGLLTLLTYSAAILSFLGGARWGVEMAVRRQPRWTVMAAAVAASLVAWGLLAGSTLLAEHQIGGFIAAFLLQWAWDSRSNSPPAWYPRLRTLLTLGAVVSLSVALEATLRL